MSLGHQGARSCLANVSEGSAVAMWRGGVLQAPRLVDRTGARRLVTR